MRAWRNVMEEWEQTAKQFKSNAEFLESLCQDKLTHLYQDKRKARKTYQEEHNKIATQFTNVSQLTRFTSFFFFFIFMSFSFSCHDGRKKCRCVYVTVLMKFIVE